MRGEIKMDVEIYFQLMDKEDKSEIEWELIKSYKILAMISDILVEESKLHLSSKDAIWEIRKYMNDNL